MALTKWRSLPNLYISKIKSNGIVTQRYNQKDYWTGVYDYFGQVSRDSLIVKFTTAQSNTQSLENGIGRKCWHDGGVEEGQFQNGQPHGFLREIFADGSYFEGIWEDGWRNGKGKEVSKNGTIKTGIWKNHNYIG